MNKRRLRLWTIGLICLVVSNLALASCAPSVVAEGQLKATQSLTATEPPYPGPTLATTTLLATAASTQRGIWGAATPLPSEPFTVGEITQMAAPPEPRYSIRQDFNVEGKATSLLLVRDSHTGAEFRIGDDSGYADFKSMSSKYIIWRWSCSSCTEKSPPSGLYAYVLNTGEQILITQAGDSAKVADDWVIYISVEDVPHRAGLRAHKLSTGEDFLITKAIPYFRERMLRDMYAFNENKVAWVDSDPVTNEISINVYDLDTRISQKLNTSPLTEPLFLSVSDQVVVWRDGFWQGYLLKQNALFTIPFVPLGWENMSYYESRHITVQGNHLYWTFIVDDEIYYFTAPIIPKGQGAQPTHIIPTPHRKPTATPWLIATPTLVALPAAYPAYP